MSSETPSPLRGEIRALTGLRAVAAGWVVLLHFDRFLRPYLEQVPLLPSVVAAGWTGVELFFVLSGFVITLRYVEAMGRRLVLRDSWRFVVNRVARVWPAWAAVTVVMFGWLWAVRSAGWDSEVIEPHPAADAPTLLRQLSMTQMWGEQGHSGVSYVLPGWSISAEWAAYLAFPVLVLLLHRLRRLPAWVLFGLAVLAMAPLAWQAYATGTPDWQMSWFPRLAWSFLSGALCALAVRKVRPGRPAEVAARGAVLLSLLAIVLGAMWAVWRRGDQDGRDYAGIVVIWFPVLVAALPFTRRGVSRWLSTGTLVYAGRVSYSVYLVHFLVLDIAMTAVWQDPARRDADTPGVALLVPALLVASALAGAALHHLVEEPSRRGIVHLLNRKARAAEPAHVPAHVPERSRVTDSLVAGIPAPAPAPIPAPAAAPIPIPAQPLPAWPLVSAESDPADLRVVQQPGPFDLPPQVVPAGVVQGSEPAAVPVPAARGPVTTRLAAGPRTPAPVAPRRPGEPSRHPRTDPPNTVVPRRTAPAGRHARRTVGPVS
ncbi:acyltransferase family protein [Modestobacter sp. SYSU DS0511]